MNRSVRAAGAVTRRLDPRIALAAAVVALAALPLEMAAVIREPASATWVPASLPIGVFAIIALARPFEPAPGEKFSLGAAVAFFAALVLPGAAAVLVIAGAALVTRIYQGRSIVSTVVNVSSLAGSTAAAALVVSSIVFPRSLAVALAGAAFWAFTLVTIGLMVSASGGARAAVGFLRREALPTATLLSLGAIGAVLWEREVMAVLLLAIPLVAVDVALRRVARERAALAALREAQEAQQQFSEDAARELRAPLAALLADLQAVDPSHLAPDEAAAIADAEGRAAELRLLTDRLLTLARSGVPSGGAHGDLADVARDALTRATPRAGVAVRLIAPPSLEVPISPELIGIVVGDLLANAVAYTRQGSIELAVATRDGAAVLTVSDTGVGIPAADLDRIFDRFVRGSNARSLAQGSGLGLTIVKRIVDAHRGSITVTSALERGTVVEVRLPLSAAAMAVEAVPQGP